MLPFTEFVHPETGRKQRVPWDRTRAKAKCDEFRNEAIEFFRKQDIERAKAVGIEVPEGVTVLPTCSFNDDGVYDVDPIASKIKHASSEVNDRWIPRWQEFCSKPQNMADAEYALVAYKPKSQRTKLPEPPGKRLDEVQEQGKRGPGRPRKQVLASV